MRQIFIIPILCYLFLLLEFCLFNLFGRWGDPHLLLLLVIFFDLYAGVRFSVWTAIWAGIFKDCFSTMPFGTHIFVYVACAYLTTYIRKNCYERGSDLSKLFLVFSVVTAHTVIMGFLHQMVFQEIRWLDVWSAIWLPEVVMTMIIAIFVFGRLRAVARVLRF